MNVEDHVFYLRKKGDICRLSLVAGDNERELLNASSSDKVLSGRILVAVGDVVTVRPD